MRQVARFVLVVPLVLGLVLFAPARAEDPPMPRAEPVPVPKALLHHDDGDSVWIRWPTGVEVVRILGMDTPETAHPEHDIPYAQPFGEAAAGFLRGCVAMADRVELLRAEEKDPYGRTLAYLLLDGRNYSVLVVEARLAAENVRHFGDNGFPDRAAAVLAAAKAAGPIPFEPPHRFRSRMRKVSAWLRERGEYPGEEETDDR